MMTEGSLPYHCPYCQQTLDSEPARDTHLFKHHRDHLH